MRVALALSLIVLLPSLASPASYLILPDGTGDFPTIQAAINDSLVSSGDTLALTDGTFVGSGNRDVDLFGKNLVICSASRDASTCAIDCQGTAQDPHRGFLFQNDESSSASLEYITIRNGYVTQQMDPGNGSGGAVVCTGEASPRFIGVVFSDNYAYAYGGGAWYYSEGAEFQSCRFYNNHARSGGALCVSSNYQGNCTIRSCSFVGNSASNSGGALFYNSQAYSPNTGVIENCVFRDNAAYIGGAVCAIEYLSLRECRFIHNTAQAEEGAVYLKQHHPTHCYEVRNCTFHGNAVCALSLESSVTGAPFEFENCTFTANEGGEVIYCNVIRSSLIATFDHVLIAHNSWYVDDWRGWQGVSLEFSCSNVFGNLQDWTGLLEGQLGVDGNISEEPLFCDLEGGNLTIDAASPCAPHSPPNPECGLIGALPVACGGPDGLWLESGSLSTDTASPGDTIAASFEIALGPCPLDSLLALDVRFYGAQGAFEAAPCDTDMVVTCGTLSYDRPVILPAYLEPGWYSCNWVLNDGVTNEYITSSGWVDSCLHVVEPPVGPVLALSQDAVEFGDVETGAEAAKVIQVANIGDAPLIVDSCTPLNPAFSVEGPVLPWEIAPDSSMAATILFRPEELGDYASGVEFTSNQAAPDTLLATGRGIEGIEGYLTIDAITTWTEWHGEEYFPPFIIEPSKIELTVRNSGEGAYSGHLRAVAIIGDLYGQGQGDRFWTGYTQTATEIQSESFPESDNPTLHVQDLGPGESTTILLGKLDHWPNIPAQDFAYKKPDFSELLTVYLIEDEAVICQKSLTLSDGFQVGLHPEIFLNCISEILLAVNLPFPIKAFLTTSPYGVEASELLGELYRTLNEDPPEYEAASEAFVNLVELVVAYVYELGHEVHEPWARHFPILGLVIAAIDEIQLNGCGALGGSFHTDLRPFVISLIQNIDPEHGEELGDFVQHIYSTGGQLRLIVDVISGEGGRIMAAGPDATVCEPAFRDGEEIDPISAFIEDQFLCAMPPDSAYTINLLGQAQDEVDIHQVFRRQDGSLTKLVYEGLPLSDGSRATLVLEQGTTDYAFAVDVENDGTTDFLWPPTTVTVAEGTPPEPVIDFALEIDGETHTLSWTNPADDDLKGVRVVLGMPDCPHTPFAGPAVVDDSLGTPGEFRSFTLEGMDPTSSYCYRAWAYDTSGNFSPPDSGFAFSAVPEVGGDAPVRTQLQLNVAPNPMASSATVRLHMPEAGDVSLLVYDAQGRQVRQLVGKSRLAPGQHAFNWDGRDSAGHLLPSGIYWMVVSLDDRATAKRMILVK